MNSIEWSFDGGSGVEAMVDIGGSHRGERPCYFVGDEQNWVPMKFVVRRVELAKEYKNQQNEQSAK